MFMSRTIADRICQYIPEPRYFVYRLQNMMAIIIILKYLYQTRTTYIQYTTTISSMITTTKNVRWLTSCMAILNFITVRNYYTENNIQTETCESILKYNIISYR